MTNPNTTAPGCTMLPAADAYRLSQPVKPGDGVRVEHGGGVLTVEAMRDYLWHRFGIDTQGTYGERS